MKTIIISGFPGVGKSSTKKVKKGKKEFATYDLESSEFSWAKKGERNVKFPENYIDEVEKILTSYDVIYDVIFVSSHVEVRKALASRNIPFYTVAPKRELKEEYLARYKERGSSDEFIAMMDSKWDDFIDSTYEDNGGTLIQLETKEFIDSALIKILS